ncbi:electron transfer flavoprotein beta subunit lysine methyltransferase-like [Diadema antillarum]|uniref:electron transfer flavoprotein beta subunit lysine methyltransferase-like n=1 Tax=Diadema antillarum TaxID=105358 RepID=UPI003A874DC4
MTSGISKFVQDVNVLSIHVRSSIFMMNGFLPWPQNYKQTAMTGGRPTCPKLGATYFRMCPTACYSSSKWEHQARTRTILSSNSSARCWESTITEHTMVTTDHMTPEIRLRLITPLCPLWHHNTDHCPFSDPFWAFYWPGGQVLTRYILDNPHIIKEKAVLDIGSGCGASAIAAVKGGARKVLAIDIDEVAAQAMRLNAALNGVELEISTKNIIGECAEHDETDHWDVVFLGDMFYDRDFIDRLSLWLNSLVRRNKCQVLIGDPGRQFLQGHPLQERLQKLYEVNLPANCIEENRGHSVGLVWELVT